MSLSKILIRRNKKPKKTRKYYVIIVEMEMKFTI